MKQLKIAGFFLVLCMLFFLTACGGGEDADVLMREASANAEKIQNCTASISSTLEFTANGKQNHFKTGNEIVYYAKPFALKSTQTSLIGETTGNSTSYTVTDANGIWFYSNSGAGWQKTSAGDIDTTPLRQVDILRLLDSVKGQKYVRETTLDSVKVHKLELTFQSEVLRSTVENIVTATGMGQGSSTIVQTLLDGTGDIYGYCYIDETTGQIARIELDATEAVNKIFQNIDGSGVTVNVAKCEIAGNVGSIGKAPGVALPAEAAAAQNVEAQG